MRKTFKLFCAAALSLLAVSSCYDDSSLWNEFDNVHGEIKDLKARVEKLEKDLKADVENLTALQDKVNTMETTLTQAIADGDAAVKKALEDALASAKAALEKAVADGDAAVAASLQAEVAKIEAAMDAFEGTMNDAVAEATAKLQELAGSLANVQAELLAAIAAGDEQVVAALEAEKAKIEEALKAVNETIKTSQATVAEKITALEALVGAKYEDVLAKMDAADKVIDGKIADVNAAVEAVKKAYPEADQEILEAFAEALASVAVQDVDEVDGKIILTLADGSVIAVSKPLENVGNGIVTTTDVNGVLCWAVITEDGEVESLDVPVGAADVDIEFSVAEDGELLYMLNGLDWISTGAYVAADAESLIDFYQGETDEIDWETWEYMKEDFYTLVFGGETYYLPIYKVDNSVVTIKAGKTYFAYGEAKTIDVAVADVTEMYVMTKPDGWKAKLNGNKLTVTAPAEANVTSGVAESEGEVLLHCTTTEGKCKIAKLAVSTTEGFSLTVNADGTFTLVNPYATVEVDELYGDAYGEFNEAVIGLATISSFEKNPTAYVNAIMNGDDHWDDIAFYVSNWKMNTMDWETGEFAIGGAYEYGVYEVDVIESSVADVYNYYTYGELPRGSQYIVWAAPVDASNGSPLTDELVFGYYTPMDVNMEVVGEPSFNEIDVELTLYGAEKFYVGHIAKEYCYNYNTEAYDLEEYLKMYISYLQYGVNYVGKEYEPGVHEVTLSELVNEMEEAAPLTPDTEYFGFVLPIISGKAAADYSFADVIVFDFETASLTEGGDIVVAFENETEAYTQLSAKLVADGAAMGYYQWYTTDEFNELEDVVADLLEGESYMFAGDHALANKTVNPGESYVIAAIAVDEAGQYGEVECVTLEAPELVYSETFVATAGEPVFTENGSNWKVTVPVTVEGGEAAKYYYYWNTSVRTEEQLAKLPLGNKGYYYYFETTTAPKDLVFYSYYSDYQYAVVVESTTGELSKPVIITVNKPSAE